MKNIYLSAFFFFLFLSCSKNKIDTVTTNIDNNGLSTNQKLILNKINGTYSCRKVFLIDDFSLNNLGNFTDSNITKTSFYNTPLILDSITINNGVATISTQEIFVSPNEAQKVYLSINVADIPTTNLNDTFFEFKFNHYPISPLVDSNFIGHLNNQNVFNSSSLKYYTKNDSIYFSQFNSYGFSCGNGGLSSSVYQLYRTQYNGTK